MSLHGYKRKTAAAIWVKAFPDQVSPPLARAANQAAGRRVFKTDGNRPAWHKALPKYMAKQMGRDLDAAVKNTIAHAIKNWPKPIRRRARRHQATDAEYRREAAAFVAAAVVRGETCPVVITIPALRNGMKYGHPISARLNEIHHTRGRAGSLLRDQRFWLAVSKQGHRFIHSNIEESRRRGWICAAGLWNTPPKET